MYETLVELASLDTTLHSSRLLWFYHAFQGLKIVDCRFEGI